jgi:hypothetical protein
VEERWLLEGPGAAIEPSLAGPPVADRAGPPPGPEGRGARAGARSSTEPRAVSDRDMVAPRRPDGEAPTSRGAGPAARTPPGEPDGTAPARVVDAPHDARPARAHAPDDGAPVRIHAPPAREPSGAEARAPAAVERGASAHTGAALAVRSTAERDEEQADPARVEPSAVLVETYVRAPVHGDARGPFVEPATPSLPAPASVPSPEAPQEHRWQAREAYLAAGAPSSGAKIELSHPTLGALTLELCREADQPVSIELGTSSLSAAIALRGAEEGLRRALADGGTEVGRFRVRTRPSDRGDAAAPGSWQPGRGDERRRS